MRYLRKPKATKPWPSVVLPCIVLPHPERGLLWAAASAYPGMPEYRCSTEPHRWYDWLAQVSLRPNSMILMPSAYQAVTRLKLWQAIKEHRIRLCNRLDHRGGGLQCIVEDPPTVLHLRIPSFGQVTICDLRNYGASVGSEQVDVFSEAAMKDVTEPQLIAAAADALTEMRQWASEYTNLIAQAGGDPQVWRYTAAGQASFIFRSHYMHTPVRSAMDRNDTLMLQESNYGGRCECRQLGEVQGPIYQFDANQLYSAAARIGGQPVDVIDDGHGTARFKQANEMEAYRFAAVVTLKTDKPRYPYRPMFQAGSYARNHVIWPVGKFQTALCGAELSCAVSCGDIQQVHVAWEYAIEPLLDDWASRMWALRNSLSPRIRPSVKALALSLYGTMGRRLKDWIRDEDDLPPDGVEVGDWYCHAADGEVMRHRVLDDKCFVEHTGGYAPGAAPQVWCWLTAAARMQLYTFLINAQEWYYCDTDSVWVGQLGKKNLEAAGCVGPELGQLRLVGEYDRVQFHGIRHYTAEALEKRAGIPAHAVKSGHNTWRWEQQASFGSHMGRQEWPDGASVVRQVRGTGLYQHGQVESDGRVTPFVLS